MKLSILVVSVDYADLLAQALPHWRAGLRDGDIMNVVTTPGDRATQALCDPAAGVGWYVTSVFTEHHAVFNKAAALSEAFAAIAWDDWWLFIDADIVPPADWRQTLEALDPVPGCLYGAVRQLEDGRRYWEGEIAGYFQLFHAKDLNARRRPLLDCGWRHAGAYDSEFQYRWPPGLRRWTGLTVTHLGEPGRNWWGRGQHAQMARMLGDRKSASTGIAPYERL